ncbi:hypothetical protein LCGC14_0434910 [marine sediment metagenome]|uniref:Uncharacterized protein n=1 Tax=marine sediment metagenome TaxID=412755 RepID=A0A0F9STB1_9ZZZZ
MPNLTREEIRIWQARIERAESYQSERHPEWRNSIKLYTGTFLGPVLSQSGDLSEVNFVYEFMKILVGSTYSRNPFIFVKARSPKWTNFAFTMQTVINYYWREKHVKQKMKSVIMDAVLQPPGWIEIGYLLFVLKNQVLRQFETDFPELKETNQKVEEEQGELDETIKNDDCFINHRSSWKMLFPDGYHDPRTSPYMIRIQDIPLLDILNNSMFKPIKNRLRNLPTSRRSDKRPPKLLTFKSPPPLIEGIEGGQIDLETLPIRLYHIHDRRSRRRFTLAQNFMEGDLFNTEWNYFIDGFTFYPLIFNEIPATDDRANGYPLSDIIPMFPQLKNLSLTYSMMNRHRKRSGTVVLVKKGVMTPTQISNAQNAQDLTIVEVDEITDQVLKALTPPALPNDVYRMYDIELQNLLRISGFNQLLQTARGIETATESENVRMGAQIRQGEKVDVIEDFTVDVARGLSGLIWQFIQDKKRIAKIIGEDEVTEEMWPSLPDDEDEARRMIQEELEFRIDAGSTRPPKDTAVEQKLFVQAVDTIEARFPGILPKSETVKAIIKKFPHMKELEELVKGFDEQEIQVAQEENQLLMQGIRQLVSPNENHKLHLQVHSQIYQTPGLEPTKEMDEHLLKHSEFDQMQSPQTAQRRVETKAGRAQKGGGVGSFSDLVGAVRSQRGVGGESTK